MQLNSETAGSIFEERAEYLSRQQLVAWTTLSDRESRVVNRLKGTGAKLLIGPRGSGKSTLMRLAYYELLENREVLPVYVNYAKHLALEPMFKTRPDATELFRQWVLAKVVKGVDQTLREIPVVLHDAEPFADSAGRFIEGLEVGEVLPDYQKISPTSLIDLLTNLAIRVGRRRIVLLFDDAAHAFSQQQQREFFEIFRQLKTRAIAPKAAVYPGVTNYSSNMHVGHDAEILEAWYRSDDPAFFSTMQEVLNKRLPGSLRDEFNGERSELLHYLALASFGLPRSLLTMVQDVLDYDEDQESYTSPTRRRADSAIEKNVQNVRNVFESTGIKIPRYSNLIAEGRVLEDRFLEGIRRFNSTKQVHQKTVTVGIKRPITREFQQVVDLMAYAGLIRHVDSLSRGSAGVFERYDVHAGFVISANALALGRSPSTRDIVSSLTKRPASGLVRGKPETFLGDDYRERCTLNLTPCANCGAERVSEDAQFCMTCGRPLTEKSVYREILQRPLTDLPIPEKKKSALARTKLVSIQDVLLDVDFTELLRGRYIGAFWAQKIFSAAEEYVSV